jgi:hypothetical protein
MSFIIDRRADIPSDVSILDVALLEELATVQGKLNSTMEYDQNLNTEDHEKRQKTWDQYTKLIERIKDQTMISNFLEPPGIDKMLKLAPGGAIVVSTVMSCDVML